jgi:hypothetical protein
LYDPQDKKYDAMVRHMVGGAFDPRGGTALRCRMVRRRIYYFGRYNSNLCRREQGIRLQKGERVKRVYISGPIKSDPEYKIHFSRMEDILKKHGYKVTNPAKGKMIFWKMLNCWRTPEWIDYMKVDIKMLIKCDFIIMLKNWENGKGARLEYHIAKELGIEVLNNDLLGGGE